MGRLVRIGRVVTLSLSLYSFSSSTAAGQTVRGTVTLRGDGTAARGAVVTLERVLTDSGLVSRSTLTNPRGAYSIRAPAPGTYELVARRIGATPHRSEPFTLATGQFHELDVVLDPATRRGALATLGTISITQATPCHGRVIDGERIATLWEDARTALLSSEIALRDRLVSQRQVRYKRELDLPSMSIVSETLTPFDSEDAGGEAWFRSLPGDSLSRLGYWRETVPGVAEFYGPDASALLSAAFVRDHCFALVDQAGAADHSVGLAFVPVASRMRDRAPADIRGTIWFDAHSALQRVEFTWTKLTGNVRYVGGEVVFSRVGDGPWVVNSWRLRMPLEVVVSQAHGTTRRNALVEEGGIILPDSIDWSRANAKVHGLVTTSHGRPLAGARIRVLGTPVEAVSADDGRYTLEGVPLGLQYVVADHDSLRAFGVRVGQSALLIDSGAPRTVMFTAPTSSQIAQTLCAGRPYDRVRGTLRVVVMDSSTGQPVRGPRVRLHVKDAENAQASDVSSAATDSDGAVVFCHVVTDRVLVLSTSSWSKEVVLRRGEVAARQAHVTSKRDDR